MNRVASPLVAILVAFALIAAACSSGGSKDLNQDASGSTTSTSATEGTTTTEGGLKPKPPVNGDPEPDDIEWVEGNGPWDRGTLAVPLDYANPDGQQIEIAMVRRQATKPRERIGILLLNPGGPGGSGIEFAEMSRFILSSELFDRFDVIGWDPRGVGESTAVTCGDSAFLERYNALDPVPQTESDRAESMALIIEFAENCRAESGYLLPYLDTESSARDMDSIRQALGEAQLNYLGFSYGTFLGATYLELFPNRVRAAVLDGAYSRSLSGVEMAAGQAAGFERSLDSFLAWCVEPRCDLAELGDPGDTLDAFLAELRLHPLPARDNRELTVGLAWTAIIYSMYVPAMWPMFDSALVQGIERGDGQGLINLADQYNDRSPDGSYDNSNFAFIAISCADAGETSDEEEALIAEAVMQAAPRVGPVWVTLPGPCDFWNYQSDPPSGPFSAPEAPTVVVVATTGDPATPYKWGIRLWRELETARFMSVKGEDHTAYGAGNACVDHYIDQYLLKLEFPEYGVRC